VQQQFPSYPTGPGVKSVWSKSNRPCHEPARLGDSLSRMQRNI
jgi:hypothetical protein